jgi:sulfur carrier protein
VLQVNDEPLAYDPGMTVEDILKKKNYLFPLVAVWIDGEFVARRRYGKTAVPDGADVKVVHMIAGG